MSELRPSGLSLPEISVHRYVLAYMLSGVIFLFGFTALNRIGMAHMPDVEFPGMVVITPLPGGSPDIIAASVSTPIEQAINGIPGIEHIRSTSTPGLSFVLVEFEIGTPLNDGFADVQAKLQQVIPYLPKDAETPTVQKFGSSGFPAMWLSLTGDRTRQQLDDYARTTIKRQLETIDGVAEIQISSGAQRAIRVHLKPARMAALGVAVNDVLAAFSAEHLRMPGGFRVSGDSEDMISLDLEFHSVEDLGALIVSYPDQAPVRLADIADIEDGEADQRSLTRFMGQPTVGIAVMKLQDANMVAVVAEVERRLKSDVLPALPPGVELTVSQNDAKFVRQLVTGLNEHLVTGTLLTALVVFLFLRNWRSTLIIACAIPVSLLGAVGAMWVLGYTFNFVTMLGLLLLIGVVVDDAIVVLENIYRHRELDADPTHAAIVGSREVVFAVLAATLTLVSIFLPVVFLGGMIGVFFGSFAVVVAVGVLVSLFVSLTLTPALCARHLSVPKTHGRLYELLETPLQANERAYRWALDHVLKRRWTVLVGALLTVMLSGYFFSAVDKAFTPEDDAGRISIVATMPMGSSLAYTSAKLEIIEQILAKEPEVESYLTRIGQGAGGFDGGGQVSKATVNVQMRDWSKRQMTQQQLIDQLAAQVSQIPGARISVSRRGDFGDRGELVQFSLTGPELPELARLADDLLERLRSKPEMGRVLLDFDLALPQVDVSIDREKARSLGVDTRQIATAVNVLAGGVNVARFSDSSGDNERYDVRIKATPQDEAIGLDSMHVRTPGGELVRLDNLARMQDRLGPAVIQRYDLGYSANFYNDPNVGEAEAIALIKSTAAEMNLPTGFRVQMQGRTAEFERTGSGMMYTFLTALLLVYMVLASQFNSFSQPLVIMVAQPLAVIGGVFALWLTGQSLNIFSMIGLVLLVGLVAKNSILLVDLTNQLRQQGRSIDDALREACPIRLRPVLMTSITIILALSPAALGVGAGANTNAPLSIAVIGGMISSTLLTLIVVPAAYSILEHGLERLRQRMAIIRSAAPEVS